MKTTTLALKRSKNRSPFRFALLIPLALVCFGLSPQPRAVCQQGCLIDQNTVLADEALTNNATGFQNTTAGYNALASNTITLSAARRRVNGINMVRLTWSGATSRFVEIQRCFPGPTCKVIITTVNSGVFDFSAGTGRVRVMYRVCEDGGTGGLLKHCDSGFPAVEEQ